jgi:hypothetical protein
MDVARKDVELAKIRAIADSCGIAISERPVADFGVKVDIVIKEFTHAQLAHACISKANADIPGLRCASGDSSHWLSSSA